MSQQIVDLSVLPAERGIYQITNGTVSYVGLSDNIRHRVRQHLESRACRSRIVLDTGKAWIEVLELLPNTSDEDLALQEWYWFEKLKQQGQILVNDPSTLGKTRSGQYRPPHPTQRVAPKAIAPPMWRHWRLPLLTFTLVAGTAVVFFGIGFLGMQSWLGRSPVQEPTAEEIEPPEREIQILPLSACQIPIELGSRGEVVEFVQEQLADLGYYRSETDGIYGPGTQAAVEAFQEAEGLDPDGVVGCETQKRINRAWQNLERAQES